MEKKIDWNYPRKWTTFRGKNVDVETIDHQHLSNTYWYCKIFQNASDSSLAHFEIEANKRFNGQLLPYRPHASYRDEIEYLYKKGYLRWINEKKRIIVYEGFEIGEINYF